MVQARGGRAVLLCCHAPEGRHGRCRRIATLNPFQKSPMPSQHPIVIPIHSQLCHSREKRHPRAVMHRTRAASDRGTVAIITVSTIAGDGSSGHDRRRRGRERAFQLSAWRGGRRCGQRARRGLRQPPHSQDHSGGRGEHDRRRWEQRAPRQEGGRPAACERAAACFSFFLPGRSIWPS